MCFGNKYQYLRLFLILKCTSLCCVMAEGGARGVLAVCVVVVAAHMLRWRPFVRCLLPPRRFGRAVCRLRVIAACCNYPLRAVNIAQLAVAAITPKRCMFKGQRVYTRCPRGCGLWQCCCLPSR